MQRQISNAAQKATKLFIRADKTAKLSLDLKNNFDFGSKLKKYRKLHNLTQAELADKLNLKFTTLRSWEQGLAKPPYRIWKNIKHIFKEL